MTNVTRKIGKTEAAAFEWLRTNGGDGEFDRDGSRVRVGDDMPRWRRETWVKLRDAGRVRFYTASDGCARVAIVEAIE